MHREIHGLGGAFILGQEQHVPIVVREVPEPRHQKGAGFAIPGRFAEEVVGPHAATGGLPRHVAIDLGQFGFELGAALRHPRIDRVRRLNEIRFVIGVHADLAKKAADIPFPKLGRKYPLSRWLLLRNLRTRGLHGDRRASLAEPHECLPRRDKLNRCDVSESL
jgi:hypothetical protein